MPLSYTGRYLKSNKGNNCASVSLMLWFAIVPRTHLIMRPSPAEPGYPERWPTFWLVIAKRYWLCYDSVIHSTFCKTRVPAPSNDDAGGWCDLSAPGQFLF